MNSSPTIEWFANLDPPGGMLDAVLEHLQCEHLDLSRRFQRQNTVSGNLQGLRDELESLDGVTALTICSTAISDRQLADWAALLPTGVTLVIYMKHWTKSHDPRVFTQSVPAESDSEFKLKVAGHIHRLVKGQPAGSRFNPRSSALPERRDIFSSIDAYEPALGEQSIVRVNEAGTNYDFLTSLTKGSKKLVVFGQDAINRNQTALPHFYRRSWLDEVDASAVILNDPALYAADDLLAGWWVGTRERDYVVEQVAIIRKIVESLDIAPHDVVFYGASAGGFSALNMASVLRGSRALVDIPQVDLRTYGARVASDATIRAGLGYDRAGLVPEEYLHRIDVISRFEREKYVPDFMYLQNNRDHTHVGAQMGAFFARLGDLMSANEWAQSQFTLKTYSAWNMLKGGHFPLSRFDTLNYLSEYLLMPRQRLRRI